MARISNRAFFFSKRDSKILTRLYIMWAYWSSPPGSESSGIIDWAMLLFGYDTLCENICWKTKTDHDPPNPSRKPEGGDTGGGVSVATAVCLAGGVTIEATDGAGEGAWGVELVSDGTASCPGFQDHQMDCPLCRHQHQNHQKNYHHLWLQAPSNCWWITTDTICPKTSIVSGFDWKKNISYAGFQRKHWKTWSVSSSDMGRDLAFARTLAIFSCQCWWRRTGLGICKNQVKLF